MGTFSGEKLKKARLFREMTITRLAEKINMTKQSVSMYENEKAEPSFEALLALSETLDFPINFFTTTFNKNYETDVTYFRSQASASKMSRTSYMTRQEFVCGVYDFLFQHISFPSLNIPNIHLTLEDRYNDAEYDQKLLYEIEYIAQQVRSFWGLGNEPITNLKSLFEKNGIFINSIKGDGVKVDAFSQRITLIDYKNNIEQENALIALMVGAASESRILFDLAHELGHIVLHQWSENIELINKEEFKLLEKQANMFGSAFLLPETSFGNDVRKYPTNLNYYIELKKKWKVSIQSMVYRAYQLGVLSNNQFKYLMSQISSKDWRKKEPLDIVYVLEKNIFQDSIDMLFREKVFNTQSFLDELDSFGLSLNPHELESLLNLKIGTLALSTNDNINILELKSSIKDI